MKQERRQTTKSWTHIFIETPCRNAAGVKRSPHPTRQEYLLSDHTHSMPGKRATKPVSNPPHHPVEHHHGPYRSQEKNTGSFTEYGIRIFPGHARDTARSKPGKQGQDRSQVAQYWGQPGTGGAVLRSGSGGAVSGRAGARWRSCVDDGSELAGAGRRIRHGRSMLTASDSYMDVVDDMRHLIVVLFKGGK